MRLLVLGASGRTGSELVRQALDSGHDVAALVRDRARLSGFDSDQIDLREGSVTDARTVDKAVAGQDAVVSALGVNSPTALLRPRLMRDAMHALVPALERQGVQRLVVLSALGVGASRRSAPLPLRLAFSTLLRGVGTDKEASEELIRGSSLDWTIVYPPQLTDGPLTHRMQAAEAIDVPARTKVSRADVAAFMLGAAVDGRFTCANAVVAA